jgi:hypothetical protein
MYGTGVSVILCFIGLNQLEFLFFSSGRIPYPRNGTPLSVSILKRTLHGAAQTLFLLTVSTQGGASE